MKRVLHSVLLLLFMLGNADAAKVIIDGRAPTYANKKIMAYKQADYLTRTLEKLAVAPISENGAFSLSFDCKAIEEIILKIDGVRSIMYVQPDAHYSIEFPDIDPNAPRSFSNNEVTVYFDTLNTYDINNLILDFEGRIDAFMSYYYVILGSAAFHAEIDTLKIYLSKVYKNVDNSWFNKYVFFSVASLEQIGGINVDMAKLKTMLFANYLYKREIEYDNPKYMAFFNQFYTDVFKLSNDKEEIQLSQAINKKRSVQLLKSVLQKEHFLRDEQVCELVIIKALGEEYYSYNYYQDNIIFMLDSIKQFSKFPEHRKIASNMIYKLTHLAVTYPAPDFTLVSSRQSQINLRQFKGKYVYLHFWASWVNSSVAEMKIMAELHKKYGKDIVFLSVNMDDDSTKWMNFLKVHPEMNWQHVYYGSDPEIMDKYEIKSLSQYFLIGPDGNFVQSPALRPTPNGTKVSIDNTFFDIYKRLHPNSREVKSTRQN